jgi:hypothetical protein
VCVPAVAFQVSLARTVKFIAARVVRRQARNATLDSWRVALRRPPRRLSKPLLRFSNLLVGFEAPDLAEDVLG